MSPTTASSALASTNAQTEGRTRLREALRGLVVAVDLDGMDTVAPTGTWTERQPTPAQGLQAALILRDAARHEAESHLLKARGAGVSWAQLFDVIGLHREHYQDAGELAYEFAFKLVHGIYPHEDRELTPRTVVWKCGTCAQYVKDRGPHERHPDDNEQGHAADCQRHADAIAAVEARDGDH